MKKKGKVIKKRKGIAVASVIMLLLFVFYIKGCGLISTFGQERTIKSNIKNSLSIYPTKNLEKFYDIEGARDSYFKKKDKGMWIFDSSMQTKKIMY